MKIIFTKYLICEFWRFLMTTGAIRLSASPSKPTFLSYRSFSSFQTTAQPKKVNYFKAKLPSLANILFESNSQVMISKVSEQNSFTNQGYTKEKNIIELINIIDRPIMFTPEYNVNPPPYDDKQYFDTLQKIHDIINSNVRLDQESYSRLYFLLERALFRPIPNIPLSIYSSDYPVKIVLHNEECLKLLYKIMEYFVRYNLFQITQNIYFKVIKNFHSQSATEQKCAVDLLLVIFEFNSNLRDEIARHVFKEIYIFQAGASTHFPVSPCLCFLVEFFKRLQLQTAINFFQLFRSSLFPLILSQWITEFFGIFKSLSLSFFQRDSATALWGFRFLMKHWPATNSSKQVIFLQEIADIISCLGSSYFKPISESLFKKMIKCIKSSNYKVVLAALQVIRSEVFIEGPLRNCEPVPRSLMWAVTSMESNWSRDVRRAVELTETALVNSKIVFTATVKTPAPKASWKQVLSFAKSVYPKERWPEAEDKILNDEIGKEMFV